jgi:hypothetical protein
MEASLAVTASWRMVFGTALIAFSYVVIDGKRGRFKETDL